MFLAAAPYFALRLQDSAWIRAYFQPAILAVSTTTNLGTLVALSHIQYAASYPFRINAALVINTAAFSLLTLSTCVFLAAAPGVYFIFLLAMVALSAGATGLFQNGAFAFAASFGRPEYMQALMAGQGVAGVLPALAQVTAVLLFPSDAESKGQLSAFFYFLAAVAISVLAIVVVVPLFRRHGRRVENRIADHMADSIASVQDAERAARKVTSLAVLFRKLRFLAVGVALTFTVTMFFPVFTAKIHSVSEDKGALFRPEAFIPLAFFFWNLGDLGGRVATALPFSLAGRPRLLFTLAAARIALLPLYLLCNIDNKGAVVSSDFFYLFVVQIVFGASNGWLGSSFMMSSGDFVDEGQREAAGAFMSLCLVVGLSVGSLLSFSVAGI